MRNMKLLIYKTYLYIGFGPFLGWFYVANLEVVGRYYSNDYYFIYLLFFIIYLFGGVSVYTFDAIIMLFMRDKSSSYLKEQKLFIIGIISTVAIFVLVSLLDTSNINIAMNLILFLVLLIINLITYFKVKIIINRLIPKNT
jgi:hypothetical protein